MKKVILECGFINDGSEYKILGTAKVTDEN